jgi:hypothetical protein
MFKKQPFTRKKVILFFIGAFLLFGAAMVNSSRSAEQKLNQGYEKICNMLPEGEYCHYCKCSSGEGRQGFGSYQCSDGTKPICTHDPDNTMREKSVVKDPAPSALGTP